MNARERLFAALEGLPTDRVPIWLLFPYHPIGCYVDVLRHPKYRRVFEASKTYAITLNRRAIGVALHTNEVRTYRERLSEDGCRIDREYVEYRGERICSEVRRGDDSVKIKKLLSTQEELEFFCSLPVETDPRKVANELDEKLPGYLADKEEFPEELGAMMLSLGEPVGALYGRSNLEEYAIWSLTCPDLVKGFLDRVMEQRRLVYRYCLEHELADVYFMVGSELASPPLVSRGTFRSWVVPYARELIQMVQAYGKKVIQHYHGQIHEILPDFLEMAPDGLHTIEAPPIGDCTMTQAYEVVGDAITLIGNIQYDCFRALTPPEMTQATREVLDECRGRRFILSPTAGPYEETIPDVMVENYLTFMKTAWEYPWAMEREV